MNLNEQFGQYETSRYLRNARDDALTQRLEDIGINLWSTDRDGNITPPRNQMHRQTLLRLYIDTLYEQYLRNSFDIEFNEADLRNRMSAGYTPPTLKTPIDFEPKCISKFGKKHYIFDSFNKGIFLIKPAKSYDDPSLNPAQKDNELLHHVQTPNEQLKFKLYGVDDEGKDITLKTTPLELFRYMEVSDFYVWCCGLGYDARLFKDFTADAALIIKNTEEFTRRFTNAVRAKLPSAKFEAREIGYYDPYTSQRSQLTPIFIKHIRYLYQNEYRFSWRLENPSDLQPFLVELGPLHDIATVLELA